MKSPEPAAPDLFSDQASPGGPLTVFHAELIETHHTGWRELFEGFTSLQAITFSSSLEFLVSLASRFEDMEIVFGSERILSPRLERERAGGCRPAGSLERPPARRGAHQSD